MTNKYSLSVAPMMKHSHRHARILWTMLCPEVITYSEMATAQAVVRNSGHAHKPATNEKNAVLQLAGCNPDVLATSSRIGQDLGYIGINLNCGCPSSRVTAGNFGACMMADIQNTADCVHAMVNATSLPVSVKCRLAIDDLDPEQCLHQFTDAVAKAGATCLIVHARKAWLNGLSPKDNRTKPPLFPEKVVALKQSFPKLTIITNGEIESVKTATKRHHGVDGVMLGRAIVRQPQLLAEFATKWYSHDQIKLIDIIKQYLDYCGSCLANKEHSRFLLTPLIALASGRPHAKLFRQTVTDSIVSGNLMNIQKAWT